MQVALSNALAALLQPAAPTTLQPGQVLDALVLKLLGDGKAQIALADQILEVMSEVPLVPGTTIQLAVKSTAAGLTLTPADGRQAAASADNGGAVERPAASDGVPQQGAVATAGPQGVKPTAVAPAQATQPQPAAGQAIVAQAVGEAATRQNSLVPLFADLAVAVEADALPPAVQQAASKLLTLPLPTDAPVSAAAVKQAFGRSGILLEARMAVGTGEANGTPAVTRIVQGQAAPAQAPDLKAALIVFRHVLKTWLGSQPPSPAGISPAAIGTDGMARPAPGSPAALATPPLPTADDPVHQSAAANPAPGVVNMPALAGEPADAEAASPQPAARTPPGSSKIANPANIFEGDLPPALERNLALVAVDGGKASLPTPRGEAAPRQDATPRDESAPRDQSAARMAAAPNEDHATSEPLPSRATTPPPPPYRGAPPSAQRVALPGISPDDHPRAIGERLLADTDAALARTTLLQAASLPDAPAPETRDPAQPHWAFEIPLATPQGTLVAQFEISRDGGRAATADAVQPAWRARFSLDVEPMGPVHVQITLSGARTAVSLWVERAESAARLRQDVPLLAQSLAQADLEPGDVTVRSGEPPRPQPAAGRFLDRAT